MSDKIKVEILEESSDKKGYPEKIAITYLGKKIEVQKKYIELLLGMDLKNEGITLTPLEYIEEARKLKLEEEKPIRKKLTDTKKKIKETIKEKKTTKKELTEEEKEERKIKVKKIFTRAAIIAGIAGGIILVTSLFNKTGKDELDNENKNGDDNNLTRQSQEGVAPTLEGTENVPGISEEYIPREEYLKYVNRSSSDWINMTDEQYLEALNAQSVACEKNMLYISLFLEGNELEGDKDLSFIQSTFIPGSPDYCIVEHFNQYRNDLVTATYNMKSRPATEAMLKGHLTEIYLFCTNQYGITVETYNGPQTFYWYNMSDEARNAVLDVLFGFTVALPHDYVMEINGVKMTPTDFGTFYEGELSRLILVNPTNRK